MKNDLIRLDIAKGVRTWQDTRFGAVIVLCLSGSARLCVNDESRLLSTDDLFLINASTEYEIELREHEVCAIFELDRASLMSCAPANVAGFSCDTAIDSSDDVRILKGYLEQVITCFYEQDPLFLTDVGRLFYEIAGLLIGRFSVYRSEIEGDRYQRIIDYVERHYAENISLEHMGKVFAVTPQYFSKYFRDHSGVSFKDHVRSVRVRHAAYDLVHSDQNLLRIAFENGFANPGAFSSAFKLAFGKTPEDYRADQRLTLSDAQDDATDPIEEAVMLIGTVPVRKPKNSELVSADVSQGQEYRRYWNDAIDIGKIGQLDGYELRAQFFQMQKDLSFSFVRTTCPLDDRSRFSALMPHVKTIDSLVRVGLRLWIAVPYRDDCGSDMYVDALQGLFAYFANRYDAANVRKWRIELTLGESERGGASSYQDCFDAMSGVMRSFGSEDGLIGPDLNVTDHSAIRAWYGELQKRGRSVSSQSFRVDADIRATLPSGEITRKISDSSFIKDRLASLSRMFAYYRDNSVLPYVTNWTCAISEPNILNDSCYRGSLLIKNLINGFGEVAALAPSSLFDAADEEEGGAPLFGGMGMVTKEGIPKPPYFAYEMMNHAGPLFLSKTEHAIVFASGFNYQVICHNCKRLSAWYYVHSGEIGYKDLVRCFEDNDGFDMRVRLVGVRRGSYLIKIRSVSPTAGSVQDYLFGSFDIESGDLHPNDVDYLSRVTVPCVSTRTVRADGNVLEFSIDLKSNEFAFAHVIYQY